MPGPPGEPGDRPLARRLDRVPCEKPRQIERDAEWFGQSTEDQDAIGRRELPGGKVNGEKSGARDVVDLREVENQAADPLIDDCSERGGQTAGRGVAEPSCKLEYHNAVTSIFLDAKRPS
jgi:hypothetical protein